MSLTDEQKTAILAEAAGGPRAKQIADHLPAWRVRVPTKRAPAQRKKRKAKRKRTSASRKKNRGR